MLSLQDPKDGALPRKPGREYWRAKAHSAATALLDRMRLGEEAPSGDDAARRSDYSRRGYFRGVRVMCGFAGTVRKPTRGIRTHLYCRMSHGNAEWEDIGSFTQQTFISIVHS